MKPILTLIPKAAKTAMTAVFAALLFVSCVSDDTPDDPADGSLVKVGDAVPAFTVTLDDGTTFTSPDDLPGHTTVLVFFNTTCPDCQRKLPLLQARHDAGERIVCISRAESAANIAAYWTAHAPTLPYAAVPDRSIYNLFAQSGIPRTYTVSPQARILSLTASK